MSCFNLQKKLPPPRRGWKGFTSTLQSNLHKLKQSKPIKNTKKQLNTLSSFLDRLRRPPLHLRREKPAATILTSAPHVNRSQHHLHRPVYVDELFTEPILAPVKLLEPSTSKKGAPSATTSKGTESSKAVQLPLWGVDERAEKFISMFYEDMRLQREISLGEYQEMLARGAM
ncbi:hypothetical protein MRB53_035430 [Persea americana]|uniref:Uncharacterized protein n=1 Tax=Persea americana TaxID=3435 RepID=A0ACC2K4L6_PERAE|nr:hypothetical protein MRB53_035430 [Persea americana]